ncbi:hypothetical protein ABKN59_008348 [Abortiporus biennis]
MILLDEKMALPPPPPYSQPPPTLVTVPPHILLKIVYETFTSTTSIEKQRKTLYWLNVSLRTVCRSLYIACMHVLRSTYLPAYAQLIRQPYTSDPFPLTSSAPSYTPASSSYSPPGPIQSIQRETKVLDLFIALKVREDVWLDESELHLERDESFRDLFDLMQPKSRMEDLVRHYGVREGVVVLPSLNGILKTQYSTVSLNAVNGSAVKPKESPLRTNRRTTTVVLFDLLSVSFSSRKVGLVLTTRERKKTIVEVERRRDERLEVAAKKLVAELRDWLVWNNSP